MLFEICWAGESKRRKKRKKKTSTDVVKLESKKNFSKKVLIYTKPQILREKSKIYFIYTKSQSLRKVSERVERIWVEKILGPMLAVVPPSDKNDHGEFQCTTLKR